MQIYEGASSALSCMASCTGPKLTHLLFRIFEVTVHSDGAEILTSMSVSLGTNVSKFSAAIDRANRIYVEGQVGHSTLLKGVLHSVRPGRPHTNQPTMHNTLDRATVSRPPLPLPSSSLSPPPSPHCCRCATGCPSSSRLATSTLSCLCRFVLHFVPGGSVQEKYAYWGHRSTSTWNPPCRLREGALRSRAMRGTGRLCW